MYREANFVNLEERKEKEFSFSFYFSFIPQLNADWLYPLMKEVHIKIFLNCQRFMPLALFATQINDPSSLICRFDTWIETSSASSKTSG